MSYCQEVEDLSHLVELYKKYSEQHNIHATHVEYIETSYNETITNPFGHLESYTTSIDTEPNILKVSSLLDSTTTNVILRNKKYFLYINLIMTKHITIITIAI